MAALVASRVDEVRGLLSTRNATANSSITNEQLIHHAYATQAKVARGYRLDELAIKGDLALVGLSTRDGVGAIRVDSLPLIRESGAWKIALAEGDLVVAAFGNVPAIEADSLALVMRTDLRDLVVSQESFLGDNRRYPDGKAVNRGRVRLTVGGFTPAAGVEIIVTANGGIGWSAVARHERSHRRCSIFVGAVPPAAPATIEGDPACSR